MTAWMEGMDGMGFDYTDRQDGQDFGFGYGAGFRRQPE